MNAHCENSTELTETHETALGSMATPPWFLVRSGMLLTLGSLLLLLAIILVYPRVIDVALSSLL